MARKNFYILAAGVLLFIWIVYLMLDVKSPLDFTNIKFTQERMEAGSHTSHMTSYSAQSPISIVAVKEQDDISVAQLEDLLLQECKGTPTEHSSLRIKVDGKDSVMSFDEYKRWQADDFIRRKANPGVKSKNPPKLRKYTDAERPNPKSLLHNWQEEIDPEAIADNVEKERLERLKLGDDDVLQIPEVKEEIFNSSYKVPNLVHFVWFGCRRMRVDHYLVILGALRYQKPRLILIHGDCLPTGEYWDILKIQGGETIRFVKRTAATKIWGIPVAVIEHRADVARLQIILEIGGIYLDTDSAILRKIDELRNYSMLLPEANYNALNNGIIIANRGAWFLKRWYHEYRYFKDNIWGHNSVIVPWALWRIFPDTIHVVKELICRPNWEEVKYIYHELYDWHNNYIMHLYTRFMKQMDKTEEHTLKELAILNTTYGQIARHILWGDEKARDITDWVVSCNQTHGLVV